MSYDFIISCYESIIKYLFYSKHNPINNVSHKIIKKNYS